MAKEQLKVIHAAGVGKSQALAKKNVCWRKLVDALCWGQQGTLLYD